MIAEGSGVTIHIAASYGRWAQRAERRHDKPEADGSIPSATTRHPSFNGQGTRLRTAKWGFDSLRVHAAISSSAAERLPHTQFGAGSSPAWSTEDEPKAVAGPGREPGVSGFESRHPPRAGGTAATALGCKPGIPHAGSSPARPTPVYLRFRRWEWRIARTGGVMRTSCEAVAGAILRACFWLAVWFSGRVVVPGERLAVMPFGRFASRSCRLERVDGRPPLPLNPGNTVAPTMGQEQHLCANDGRRAGPG
jgi:hypothetical protein